MRKFREILAGGDKGFTLIELLVVIAVLGILAAIAIPRLSGVSDQARVTEAVSIVGSFRTAQEVYYTTNDNNYAGSSDLDDLKAYVEYNDTDWSVSVSSSNEGQSYTIFVEENVSDSETAQLQAKYSSGNSNVETSINGGLSL
jgi:general secretion pathway protein G